MTFDILVIGGGAAGMMAAISSASEPGIKVAIIEKNTGLGKKVLATGNGRCNVSNTQVDVERYHGSVTEYFDTVFGSFDNKKTEEFFNTLGVNFKEENNGRLFPTTNKASTIVAALENDLIKKNVSIFNNLIVKNIFQENLLWHIVTEEKTFLAKKIILATGGKAAFRLGSSGDGLFWSLKLGHQPTSIYASLVPIETKETIVKDLMGIKLLVKASAIINDKVLREIKGDILFTHYGVSGPAAMGIAGAFAPNIENENCQISLNFFPDMSSRVLDEKITKIISDNPRKKIAGVLSEILPDKFAKKFSDNLGYQEKNVAELSKRERLEIVNNLTNFVLTPSKIRPLKEAQVTAGGISVSEIYTTLESKKVPGLYFVGEILDIDGDSGGYNLQWAWSSGYYAGKNAVKSLEK